MKSLSHARLFATPWIVACTKLLHPWDFQGKSTGVGCHFLLQGIFPTQGSNPGLSHYRQTLYHLSHQGSPERIWECVAIPFSRGSSWPRDWTPVSWIAGRFFTIWAALFLANVRTGIRKQEGQKNNLEMLTSRFLSPIWPLSHGPH